MSLSGRTSFQRMEDAGQPYTRVVPDIQSVETEVEVEGEIKKGLKLEPAYRIYGYTLEEQFHPDQEDEEPSFAWQEIDLGLEPTLDAAHKSAHDWRESLRGQYPIR